MQNSILLHDLEGKHQIDPGPELGGAEGARAPGGTFQGAPKFEKFIKK